MKKVAAGLPLVAMGVSGFAWSCGDKPSVLDATAKADAIFVGRVTRPSIAHRKFDGIDGYRQSLNADFAYYRPERYRSKRRAESEDFALELRFYRSPQR